ncbi:MAG: bacteriohemerythrin [Treponema sp.]|nr:bacteriohemerythrin [Treponema sp.]
MADELVTWNDSYLIGNEQIDAQHKELIKLINEFYSGVQMGGIMAKVFFIKMIQGALQYIKIHFSTEEEIMQKIEYPHYLEHKKLHENFIKKINQQVQAFEAEDQPDPANFVKFLMDWVLQHIAQMDKKYVPYLTK